MRQTLSYQQDQLCGALDRRKETKRHIAIYGPIAMHSKRARNDSELLTIPDFDRAER